MRLHVLYAGGTIGMAATASGLAPGADLEGWLYRLLESTELTPSDIEFSELHPLIDSSNATPETWQAIIDAVRAAREHADAFVVLHGTDTMSYTTSAASFALTGFGKPTVFTGAQYPLGTIESDAVTNMLGALNAALSLARRGSDGVYLFFGQHLFAGNRVKKASSWSFEGFSAPSSGPVARIGAPWHWYPHSHDGTGWEAPKPYRRHDVVVAHLVPGMTAARLSALLAPLPEALLLRTYGSGNVPSGEPGFVRAIEEAVARGCAVVVTSQCEQAKVLLGHYETGAAIAAAGALDAVDMTVEAAYAKTVFLLSQGLDAEGLRRWMSVPIAGELTAA